MCVYISIYARMCARVYMYTHTHTLLPPKSETQSRQCQFTNRGKNYIIPASKGNKSLKTIKGT